MAQAGNCDGFQVGTKAWTDCVHDSTTGGGLMPWIVVIPLGVMVVGMFIGFARQFSGAGRQRAAAHGTAGVAGSWLIFVSLIELAIGVGSLVAARRAPGPGGGYSISATVLLGVGTLLFIAGFIAKIKGRQRARIYHSGLPGEATIRAVHETGMMVNNRPVYQFDLDVEGSGFAPTSTRHREAVPFWMAGRVGPDTKVPVKVDPANPGKVIFDWDRFTSSVQQATAPLMAAAAGGGAGQASAGALGGLPMPSSADMNAALQAARATGGSEWHLGKIFGGIALLFVLAIVGGGLYFFSTIFNTVSDATSGVTDQVNDAFDDIGGFGPGAGSTGRPGGSATTLEVSRPAAGRRPVGYSVALPVGWLDLTESEEELQPPLMVDLVLKPQTPSEARIVVTRSVRFLEAPAPPNADIGSVRRELLAEYGDSLAGSGSMRLAGEPAVRIDVTSGGDGLSSRQVAVMRGGQVIFIGLTAEESEFRDLLPVFEDLLASWKWHSS